MISLNKIEFVQNEEIKNLTTYKTKGCILGAFYPKTEREFIYIYSFLRSGNQPFIVVGNGSNFLISDTAKIFVVSTKKLNNYIIIKNSKLYVSSSTMLSAVYSKTMNRNLSGFEALATIPATIGGAIKNNASAFNQTIFDNLEYIKVFDGKKSRKIYKDKIEYAYHKTNITNCIILSAKFNLKGENKYVLHTKFLNYQKTRLNKQPKEFSCGSIFQNPENQFAGELIEKCGLKGLTQNDAQISDIHANFIINNGNARFEDIIYLINLCKEKVFNKFKIKLEEEVEIIK